MRFPESEVCPFCERLSQGIATDSLLAQSERCVAFLDNYPLNPGHALLIPRAHQPDFFALSSQEQAEMWQLLPEVRATLEARFGQPDGYNLGVNIGQAAGQTVGHVHLHLIPRLAGDADPQQDGSFDPRGGVRWVIPQRAAYWR